VQWRFIAADGVEMPLEEGTSAFITMNPGYIGRAELPESLKALFRPITVVVPDRQLIMENMLMAEGFETAKVLSHPTLCSCTLSQALNVRQIRAH
jgi:dynein heavy chain, axonemal